MKKTNALLKDLKALLLKHHAKLIAWQSQEGGVGMAIVLADGAKLRRKTLPSEIGDERAVARCAQAILEKEDAEDE